MKRDWNATRVHFMKENITYINMVFDQLYKTSDKDPRNIITLDYCLS